MSIRWGIIGCGDVVRRRVAQAIIDHEESQLVAACRRNKDALHQFCDDYDVEHRYQHHDELLSNDSIDAVYVATPVRWHHEQTLAAARAGKHVLVEKPMAMSRSECEEMVKACNQENRVLGVAYYRRFYPVVARIKQLIAEGVIGEPRAVSAVTCNAFTMTPNDEGYWRVVLEEGGGGALMDIGSHRLDLFQEVLGPITDVRGLCDQIGGDYAADNTVSVTVRFANGCHGQLQCYFGVAVDPDEFTITGTCGRLSVSPLNRGDLQIETSGGVVMESHPPAENFNLPLISDFVVAIHHGTPPRIDGNSGLMTNDVMERAYQCSRS